MKNKKGFIKTLEAVLAIIVLLSLIFTLTPKTEIDISKPNSLQQAHNIMFSEISQNISFPVQVTSQNNMVQVKSETFTIDRTKWGINYGSKSIFDNLGDKFIDDDMEITIDVTAVM